MRRARSSQTRGAAIVELVLGSLVFVTVLVMGIHFAEIGFLSVKVQEATASALWDATARRANSFANGPQFYNSNDLRNQFTGPVGPAPGPLATANYTSNSGIPNRGDFNSVQQVFTRSSGLNVNCQPAAIDLQDADPFRWGGGGSLTSTYGDPTAPGVGPVDGMQCWGSATLTAYNIPQHFMEGHNGFFNTQNYEGRPLQVCGTGRAVGGSCSGSFGIVLGDWGFTGSGESDENDVNSGGNGAYYTAVSNLFYGYGGSQGSAGSQLVQFSIQMPSPLNENVPYLSFKGSESGFTQGGVGGDWTSDSFQTSPSVNYPLSGCFLGQSCN